MYVLVQKHGVDKERQSAKTSITHHHYFYITLASAAFVAACFSAFSPELAWVGTGWRVLMALDKVFRSFSMDSN